MSDSCWKINGFFPNIFEWVLEKSRLDGNTIISQYDHIAVTVFGYYLNERKYREERK